MCETVRVLPFLALGLALGLATTLVTAQDGSSLLHSIFNTNKDCDHRGLCPYVRRLIPHLGGYTVDGGHIFHQGNSHEPPSLCGNLCTGDHGCPGFQKCCPTNCGYACFDPVFVAEH